MLFYRKSNRICKNEWHNKTFKVFNAIMPSKNVVSTPRSKLNPWLTSNMHSYRHIIGSLSLVQINRSFRGGKMLERSQERK